MASRLRKLMGAADPWTFASTPGLGDTLHGRWNNRGERSGTNAAATTGQAKMDTVAATPLNLRRARLLLLEIGRMIAN